MPTGTWFDTVDDLARPLWDDPIVGEDLPIPVIANANKLNASTVSLTFSHPMPEAQIKVWRRVWPSATWVLDQTLDVGDLTAIVEGLALAAITELSVTAIRAGFDESERSGTTRVTRGPVIDLIHVDDMVMPADFPVTVTGTVNPDQGLTLAIGGTTKSVTANGIGVFSAVFSFAEVGTGLKTATATVTVDAVAIPTTRSFVVGPQPPVILSIPTGTSPVMIVGTSQANATIKLYVDGTLRSSSIQADASGNWSFSLALTAGAHAAQATQTVSGLESTLSTQLPFTISQSGGGEPPPGPFPPAPEPPPAELPSGLALSIVGVASPIDQGDSREYQVFSEEGLVEDFEVESSAPGTIRAELTTPGSFTLTVIGGGDEQVTVYVRKEGYATASLVLRIIPSFAVLGTIVVSGDRGLLDQFRRRG